MNTKPRGGRLARAKSYQGLCGSCGAQFLSSYCYTLYCSNACRQRAFRRRVQTQRERLPLAQTHQVELLGSPRSAGKLPPIQRQLPPIQRQLSPIQRQLSPAPSNGSQIWESKAWQGTPIARRVDGFVNATAMAKANGRHLPHYLANERTREYQRALSGSVGIPTDLLIQSTTTGPNDLRGTWIHPRLAVDLARWISPAFAVWMDGWFLESIQAPPTPPVMDQRALGMSPYRGLTYSMDDLDPDPKNWTTSQHFQHLNMLGSLVRHHALMCEYRFQDAVPLPFKTLSSASDLAP